MNNDDGTENHKSEMKVVYDSFEIYNWHDDLSPVKTTEAEALRSPAFRQLLTTPLEFATDFYDRIRHQSLQRYQTPKRPEEIIRRQVRSLREEE
eukprot:56687-Amphidinium_carterae.1